MNFRKVSGESPGSPGAYAADPPRPADGTFCVPGHAQHIAGGFCHRPKFRIRGFTMDIKMKVDDKGVKEALREISERSFHSFY